MSRALFCCLLHGDSVKPQQMSLCPSRSSGRTTYTDRHKSLHDGPFALRRRRRCHDFNAGAGGEVLPSSKSWLSSSNATPYRRATAAVPSKCRSEEHTSELQSLMRISYAVFCL